MTLCLDGGECSSFRVMEKPRGEQYMVGGDVAVAVIY